MMPLHYRSENTVRLRTPLTHAVKPSLYLDFQFLQSFTFIGQILICVLQFCHFFTSVSETKFTHKMHITDKKKDEKDCFTRFLISGICLFVHKGIKLHYKPGFWAKKKCVFVLFIFRLDDKWNKLHE